MTSIAPFAAGTYAASRRADLSAGLRAQFDVLNRQLTTQTRADTYGGLGQGRSTSLDARARIAALAGYDAGITGAQLRVKLTGASLQQVATVAADTRTNLLAANAKSVPSVDTIRGLVEERLESAVDALNQESDGRYLFAGRATTTQPVESADHILNGDPARGLAGVVQLIDERTAADLGAGTLKTGRLTLTPPPTGGTSVALAEDASASTRANFGFRILASASTSAGAVSATATPGTAAGGTFTFATQPQEGDVVRVAIDGADGAQTFVDLVATANPPAGSTTRFAIGADAAATGANLTSLLAGKAVASAQSATPPGVSLALSGGSAGGLALAVNAQPSVGDAITVTLGLRDGTTTTLRLAAAAPGSPTTGGSFAIGATTAETAANLSTALGQALDAAATGPLAGSAAVLGSRDFFAGSSAPGLAARRIAGGSPFTGATGFATASGTSTVTWYKGEVTADPRGTAPVQVGTSRTVGTGATADEPALRDALAALAAFAGGTVGTAGATRYAALTERTAAALAPPDGAPTITSIASAFAAASTTLTAAKADHTTATGLLQDAIQDVEGVSVEEVATKLLTLQTQLQASYQTTANLSKLSLVNFL